MIGSSKYLSMASYSRTKVVNKYLVKEIQN